METIAFVLAGAAAIGAAALWFTDASRRRRADEPAAAADPDETTVPDAPEAGESAEPENTAEQPDQVTPDDSEPIDVEVEEDPPVADTPEPVTEPEEEQPIVEPAEPTEPVDAAQDESAEESPASGRKPRTRSGISLPGSQRRDRRSWAETNGWEFKREDEYLDDEWSRGAAASGAAVRDVISGAVYGKEMHLVDLAGVTVMAMRRGAASEVVVDLRRASAIPADREGESPDLVQVSDINGFRMFATEAGPAERFLDERVKAALEALPELVTAVWAEGDWFLAQTAKGSRQETWDEMCAPLAALADAARTLPPPLNSPQALNLEDLDPTRLMPPAQHLAAAPLEPVADIPASPAVIRPEEPLELPTRVRSESRGVVEPRAVGADEVEPIAEGTSQEGPKDYNGTRILRDLTTGSSIFDDLAQELGTDPLNDDKN